MKYFVFLFSLLFYFCQAQHLSGIQLFNPETGDETPVITKGKHLILKFDDLSAKADGTYRYTIKHFDRNWEDDGLFFGEFAEGPTSEIINDYRFSFNTSQRYTHYTLRFPNGKIKPKISGNYELIVFKESPSKTIFKKRFCLVETGAKASVSVERFFDNKNPSVKQRLQVSVPQAHLNLDQNLQHLGLSVIQNNNWETGVNNLRSYSLVGPSLSFQQTDLVFPGNNEFYYFDNKNLYVPMNTIASIETENGGKIHTYLHALEAFPANYVYNPGLNGAFYFRRDDSGIERNADTEADYSWVVFSLNSKYLEGKDLYVLGMFNDYQASDACKMTYNFDQKRYIAKIYLKQGFYNYSIAARTPGGELNFSEINGNFWQTENLYQAFLYYTPWGKNYDGILAYGEHRPVVK